MKVLRDVVSIEGSGRYDVVVRNMTEDFWLEVIENSMKYSICAVGTPGIGRTSKTYVLIRLLLQQNKTVNIHSVICYYILISI